MRDLSLNKKQILLLLNMCNIGVDHMSLIVMHTILSLNHYITTTQCALVLNVCCAQSLIYNAFRN